MWEAINDVILYGFPIATIAMFVAKKKGKIRWSWWIVFAPLIAWGLMIGIVFTFFMFFNY